MNLISPSVSSPHIDIHIHTRHARAAYQTRKHLSTDTLPHNLLLVECSGAVRSLTQLDRRRCRAIAPLPARLKSCLHVCQQHMSTPYSADKKRKQTTLTHLTSHSIHTTSNTASTKKIKRQPTPHSTNRSAHTTASSAADRSPQSTMAVSLWCLSVSLVESSLDSIDGMKPSTNGRTGLSSTLPAAKSVHTLHALRTTLPLTECVHQSIS